MADPISTLNAPNRYDTATDTGMSQLKGLETGTPSPIDTYNAALAKYGVTDARASVQNLRTQLAGQTDQLPAIEAGINEKAKGTNVTEAQRQHLVAAAEAPMASTISSIARSLNADLKNLGMDIAIAQKANDYTIQGNQQKRQAILDQIKLNMQMSKDANQRQEWAATYTEKSREFNAQQALEQQKLAETVRHNKAGEAYARYAASHSSSGGSSGGGGYSSAVGGSSGASAAPSYGFKNGKDAKGGYWFNDYNGNPISAATYAKMIGVSTNTLVRKMAASGDAGAQSALKSGLNKAFTWGT